MNLLFCFDGVVGLRFIKVLLLCFMFSFYNICLYCTRPIYSWSRLSGFLPCWERAGHLVLHCDIVSFALSLLSSLVTGYGFCKFSVLSTPLACILAL